MVEYNTFEASKNHKYAKKVLNLLKNGNK